MADGILANWDEIYRNNPSDPKVTPTPLSGPDAAGAAYLIGARLRLMSDMLPFWTPLGFVGMLAAWYLSPGSMIAEVIRRWAIYGDLHDLHQKYYLRWGVPLQIDLVRSDVYANYPGWPATLGEMRGYLGPHQTIAFALDSRRTLTSGGLTGWNADSVARALTDPNGASLTWLMEPTNQSAAVDLITSLAPSSGYLTNPEENAAIRQVFEVFYRFVSSIRGHARSYEHQGLASAARLLWLAVAEQFVTRLQTEFGDLTSVAAYYVLAITPPLERRSLLSRLRDHLWGRTYDNLDDALSGTEKPEHVPVVLLNTLIDDRDDIDGGGLISPLYVDELVGLAKAARAELDRAATAVAGAERRYGAGDAAIDPFETERAELEDLLLGADEAARKAEVEALPFSSGSSEEQTTARRKLTAAMGYSGAEAEMQADRLIGDSSITSFDRIYEEFCALPAAVQSAMLDGSFVTDLLASDKKTSSWHNHVEAVFTANRDLKLGDDGELDDEVELEDEWANGREVHHAWHFGQLMWRLEAVLDTSFDSLDELDEKLSAMVMAIARIPKSLWDHARGAIRDNLLVKAAYTEMAAQTSWNHQAVEPIVISALKSMTQPANTSDNAFTDTNLDRWFRMFSFGDTWDYEEGKRVVRLPDTFNAYLSWRLRRFEELDAAESFMGNISGADRTIDGTTYGVRRLMRMAYLLFRLGQGSPLIPTWLWNLRNETEMKNVIAFYRTMEERIRYAVSAWNSVHELDAQRALDVIFGTVDVSSSAYRDMEYAFLLARADELTVIREAWSLVNEGIMDRLSATGPEVEEAVARFQLQAASIKAAVDGGGTYDKDEMEILAGNYAEIRTAVARFKDSREMVASFASGAVATVTAVAISVGTGGAGTPLAAAMLYSAVGSVAATVGTRILIEGPQFVETSEVKTDVQSAAIEGIVDAATGGLLSGGFDALRLVGRLGGAGAKQATKEAAEAVASDALSVATARTTAKEIAGDVISGVLEGIAGGAASEVFMTANDFSTWDQAAKYQLGTLLAAAKRGALLGGLFGLAGGALASFAAAARSANLPPDVASQTADLYLGLDGVTDATVPSAEAKGMVKAVDRDNHGDLFDHETGDLTPAAAADSDINSLPASRLDELRLMVGAQSDSAVAAYALKRALARLMVAQTRLPPTQLARYKVTKLTDADWHAQMKLDKHPDGGRRAAIQIEENADGSFSAEVFVHENATTENLYEEVMHLVHVAERKEAHKPYLQLLTESHLARWDAVVGDLPALTAKQKAEVLHAKAVMEAEVRKDMRDEIERLVDHPPDSPSAEQALLDQELLDHMNGEYAEELAFALELEADLANLSDSATFNDLPQYVRNRISENTDNVPRLTGSTRKTPFDYFEERHGFNAQKNQDIVDLRNDMAQNTADLVNDDGTRPDTTMETQNFSDWHSVLRKLESGEVVEEWRTVLSGSGGSFTRSQVDGTRFPNDTSQATWADVPGWADYKGDFDTSGTLLAETNEAVKAIYGISEPDSTNIANDIVDRLARSPVGFVEGTSALRKMKYVKQYKAQIVKQGLEQIKKDKQGQRHHQHPLWNLCTEQLDVHTYTLTDGSELKVSRLLLDMVDANHTALHGESATALVLKPQNGSPIDLRNAKVRDAVFAGDIDGFDVGPMVTLYHPTTGQMFHYRINVDAGTVSLIAAPPNPSPPPDFLTPPPDFDLRYPNP